MIDGLTPNAGSLQALRFQTERSCLPDKSLVGFRQASEAAQLVRKQLYKVTEAPGI